MPVQIGARPDSGFDDPLGMLTDCHRRIELFLNILHRAVRQAEGRALNTDERHAVESALHYFRESGPRHNQDEEESLFPRLRSQQARDVLAEVERLETEHQEGDALHDEVALLYSKWIAEEHLSPGETARLASITERLQTIYKGHIRMEEEIVFPRAAQLFEPAVIAAMGAEFKARRAH